VAVELIKPLAVVFDNDGLLLDTEPCWTSAQEALFRSRGQVAPAAAIALEDSPPGVARAAGLWVIGIPSVPGVLQAADLVAGSLAAGVVHRALGLEP
jgi:beta-phosphoglucomutase-like phosphatase (HAD superfamily)